jgi:hypothetical protein
MKKLKTTFILIIIFFASCAKKLSELDFEKNVMTVIFLVLVSSGNLGHLIARNACDVLHH